MPDPMPPITCSICGQPFPLAEIPDDVKSEAIRQLIDCCYNMAHVVDVMRRQLSAEPTTNVCFDHAKINIANLAKILNNTNP
jgi:hypothetical protein